MEVPMDSKSDGLPNDCMCNGRAAATLQANSVIAVNTVSGHSMYGKDRTVGRAGTRALTSRITRLVYGMSSTLPETRCMRQSHRSLEAKQANRTTTALKTTLHRHR
jgi:hypothetical protein